MGMDWHSSGITTSVIGALKRGLEPLSGELGIHVCGGRGKQSRKTPFELAAVGERVGIDGSALANVSRLVAKVDSAAVQDGFDLYLHGFIVTDDGKWTVVQQGMNDSSRTARRYHWLSEGLQSFVEEPHKAIEGIHQGEIVNLTDRRAESSRRAQLELLDSLGPDGLARELAAIEAKTGQACLPVQLTLPHLVMPAHHDVRASDVLAPGSTRPSPRPPIGDPPTSPNCFSFPASARARCGRSRWWPKWCTARPIASPIRRASPSPMAARTAIRSRCRSRSMTRRSRS